MAASLTQAPESLFWYWINERHAIYLRRARGEPKPWTADSILRYYKFTNPFRENDRGTVWLRENFLEPHWVSSKHDKNCAGFYQAIPVELCSCNAEMHNLALLAFNICWFRMFNWTGTGELLGWRESWPVEEMKEVLTSALAQGKQVFTGAHIVYSTPGLSKIDCIVNVCQDLYHYCMRGLPEFAREKRSLQAVYEKLREVHCVGGFMAYEMVTDMRHTRLLDDATDIMTWANPGPGAKRGLQRLGLPSKPDIQAIGSMRRLLLDSEFSVFPAKHRKYCETPRLASETPALEMRDIEHSLCEFDKYCRVYFNEGEPRSKFPGDA